MKCSYLLLAAVAGCAAFLTGCSTAGSDVKKIHVALTLDQQPLTDADVKLIPKDDPELGDGIEGRTASDGKVDLVPNPKRPFKAGRYILLVRRLVREDGTPFKLEEDIAVRTSSTEANFGAHNDVPAAYWDRQRALIIVDVTPGESTVTQDLKKNQR
jgi:hypothetical protein